MTLKWFYVGILVMGLGMILILSQLGKNPQRSTPSGMLPTAPPVSLESLRPTATIEGQYEPGREPMTLPADFRQTFIHYATVERNDGHVRRLWVSPNALEALAQGQDFPERSMFLIEAFLTEGYDSANHPILGEFDPEIHASERRTTWKLEDMRTTSRSGDWNFAAFDESANGVSIAEGINDCFSCHEGAAGREFTFSLPLLQAYLATGEVQYRFCNQPGREICRF